jgi:Trp operon repressor
MVDLVDVLMNVKTREEASVLLEVLLTPTEADAVNQRLRASLLLLARKTQRYIAAELKISNVKVARCARVLRKAPPLFSELVSRFRPSQ